MFNIDHVIGVYNFLYSSNNRSVVDFAKGPVISFWHCIAGCKWVGCYSWYVRRCWLIESVMQFREPFRIAPSWYFLCFVYDIFP